MKKIVTLTAGLLLAQSAMAADLPVKSPPYIVAPILMWDGFYVGAMGGYLWNNSTTSFTGNDPVSHLALDYGAVPTSLDTKSNGGFIGGTIGYGRQYGPWVLGLELDAAWASTKKNESTFLYSETVYLYPPEAGTTNANLTTTAYNQLNWFGTVRGRVGYLVTPTTLLFATGGLAVGQAEAQSTHTFSIGGYQLAAAVGTFNDTRAGWTAGAGVEQKFWDHWSMKAEYRHIDLGTANWSASTSLTGNPVQFNAQADLKYDMVLLGLNYHW